jgi:predicted DsbA family dithiol-disulfide isomerase
MCPFCYIGKRRFEAALAQFKNADDVEIEWKSFQLSPGIKTDPGKSIHQYLAEHKGISIEQAKALNDRVTQMAKEVGLVYNFDKAIPANSFRAHRFSHMAKQHGLQDKAEELLFRSYFTEGKNTDDVPTLVELGREIGLDPAEVTRMLESEQYAEEVKHDISEARQIGVSGVPFFVFNRKYAVSGAQESKVFVEVLEKSFGF